MTIIVAFGFVLNAVAMFGIVYALDEQQNIIFN